MQGDVLARPFLEHEEILLFGRERQVREVLERLRQTQFVAVLGGAVWWWADPTLSVGRLHAIEHGVYRWRLETLRALIIERLKEGE